MSNLSKTISPTRRYAKDAWHAARFLMAAPATVAGAMFASLTGGTCHFNRDFGVFVYTGAWTPQRAGAYTMGATVITKYDIDEFMAHNDGQLLAHEVKHTDQWATLGVVGFAVLYGLETLRAELLVKRRNANLFEVWAGLKDGGYV